MYPFFFFCACVRLNPIPIKKTSSSFSLRRFQMSLVIPSSVVRQTANKADVIAQQFRAEKESTEQHLQRSVEHHKATFDQLLEGMVDDEDRGSLILKTFGAAQTLSTAWNQNVGPVRTRLMNLAAEIHNLCDALHFPNIEPTMTTPLAANLGRPIPVQCDEDLSSVITESSFCPNVDVLPDVFHPAVALYGAEPMDQVLIGLYASSVLNDFCVHRGRIRRFTLLHLLCRLNWSSETIQKWIIQLDDTLYRRIINDVRLSFLAECHSPKIHAYVGRHWIDVWDAFLNGSPPYTFEGQETVVISTLLSALHRREREPHPEHYMSSDDMQNLAQMDANFIAFLKERPDMSHLMDHHIQSGFLLRAWPMSLYSLAMDHITHYTQHCKISVQNGPGASPELSETILQASCAYFYGAVQEEDREAFNTRREELKKVVQADSTENPEAKEEAPSSVVDEMQYRRVVARRLRSIARVVTQKWPPVPVHDPVQESHPLGDSGLGVHFLYPTD